MYFIVLRYRSTGYIEIVQNEDDDGDDEVATWPTEHDADEWIRNNTLCQSGQVAYAVYELP